MLDKKGMITIEAIIVFPITLIIMLILFGIITAEYKTAHKIIGLNGMALELMTDQGKIEEYDAGEGRIDELNLFFVDKITIDMPIKRAMGNMKYLYSKDYTYTSEMFKFHKGKTLVFKSALKNTILNLEEGRFIDEGKQ